MKRTILLSLLLASLSLRAIPLPAQEAPPDPLVRATGIGSLVFAGGEYSIPVSLALLGPMVGLQPIVEILGGEVEVGPLGQSHRLRIAESVFVLGPDSSVMTRGEEIIALSQSPIAGADGLHVPLDVLERTYGELLGYEFSWQPGTLRLTVSRRPLRELPLEIDRVHFRGVTTLVLQFPEAPRYQIHQLRQALEVEILGDRLSLRGGTPSARDPLIRDIVVTTQRVRIELAQDAVVASPYVLRRPYRLVFDISRERSGAAAPSDRTAPRRAGQVRTVVIDPGHGGGESGAIGPSGSAEKEICLILARTLKRRLEGRLPVKVVLTRNEDADLPLETRAALANQNKADLFVSLHLNSSTGSEARGAETYFLSMEASDAAAASTAELENLSAADGESARDDLYGLQLILWDLAQSRHLAESQRLASLIQEELNQELELRDRGVKQAPFRVLMGAAMPAVLVELGFLSNPEEEARLQDPAYRAQLVEALVRAIVRFKAQVEERQMVLQEGPA